MFGESANLDHTQRCDHLLAEAHLLVQTHNEFLELSTEGLSPHDVELISQQRVHFLDHIQISVGHLESLIEHQQALVDIITRPSRELSTGVPVVYPDELPTAHRVPTESPILSPVPHNTVEPVATTPPTTTNASQNPFYAVRRGHTIGIYRSWTSARAQVDGYPHNEHRRFNNFNDAWAYVYGTPPPSAFLPPSPFL
jgi:hypothetical protein